MRRNLGAAVLALWMVSGCVPNVTVRRHVPVAERAIENIAIVEFWDHTTGSAPHTAELATDAFSLELKKYFPDLVDRYRVRDWLKRRGMPEGAVLEPVTLRALGEELGVDAVFVGALTAYEEKGSFLGWNGRPHIGLECRLVSTNSGEEILQGRAEVTESYLIPAENPREMALFGVRKLTDGMRLDERFGPPVLTRADPLWRQAMEAYQRRRFWEAAEAFGAITAMYRPSELRDEAAICAGRSLEELGLGEAAARVYQTVIKGPLAPRALARLAEVWRVEGRTADVLRIEAELASRYGGSPEATGARYTAGIALAEAGDRAGAESRLMSIDPNGPWGRFADYALAPLLMEDGDTAWAMSYLALAAADGAPTESERRLAEESRLMLGHLHFAASRPFEARRWYEAAAATGNVEAAVALGWMAAEEERHGDAIAILTPVAENGSPRWAAEASLLIGSCRSRLGEWTEAERDFGLSLARCDEWREEEPRLDGLREDRAEARAAMETEVVPRAGEIAALVTSIRDEAGEKTFRELRARQTELALRLERTSRELEGRGPSSDEAAHREAIRERAEFSFAQAGYINGTGGTGGVLVGARNAGPEGRTP